MNETITTLVGNIGGGDPELRFTPDGTAVCKFRMACTPRRQKDGQWVDGDPSWYQVTAWRKLAENVAESLTNGAQVIVYGPLSVRQYEDKEGVKRTSVEVEAWAVGVGLQFATAKPVKEAKGGGGRSTATAADDPWADAQPAAARPAQAAAAPW